MVQQSGGVHLLGQAEKNHDGKDLHCDEYDALSAGGRNDSPVAHEGERQQIDGQQHGNGFKYAMAGSC